MFKKITVRHNVLVLHTGFYIEYYIEEENPWRAPVLLHKKANYKIDLHSLILQLWLRWFNKHFQFNLSYNLNFNNYT